MTDRVLRLAYQLLTDVPKAEVTDLIQVLTYYNNNFNEADRARAMETGSTEPGEGAELERVVKKSMTKTAGSQSSYITTNQSVCRCCGK